MCARRNRLGPDANLDDEDLAPVASFLRDEAETLITELEAFGVALRSLPYHRRVQYGDHIYRMTMSLHLITDILGLPASHPRVRAIVPAALELCSEISMQPVMLVWPLLWLARVCNMMEREWLRGLLSSYADQCELRHVWCELTKQTAATSRSHRNSFTTCGQSKTRESRSMGGTCSWRRRDGMCC